MKQTRTESEKGPPLISHPISYLPNQSKQNGDFP